MPGRKYGALVFLLGGCGSAPPLPFPDPGPLTADPWSDVASACELDPTQSASEAWPAEGLSNSCTDALLASVVLDASFDDLVHEAMVEGLWLLAATRLPPLHELDVDGFTSPELVEQMYQDALDLGLDDPPLQQLFFDEVSALCPVITRHPEDSPVGSYANFSPSECGFFRNFYSSESLLSPDFVAEILVHEAWHARGPLHVRCPDEPADSDAMACDDHLDGSYGTAAAWRSLAATANLDDPQMAAMYEELAWARRARVLDP